MHANFRMRLGAFIEFWKGGRRAVGAAAVAALLASQITAAGSAQSQRVAEDLFNDHVVPRLRIEIPPEGLAVLRDYVWDRDSNGQDRTNVLATVLEGDRRYTNVAIHLKGGLGSFRPLDQKPALTLQNVTKLKPPR